MSKSPFPKVKVVWHDAYSVDEWVLLKDYKIKPQVCTTEGRLVLETDSYIAVAPTLNWNEKEGPEGGAGWSVSHFICIPRGMILKMTKSQPRTKKMEPQP